VGGVDGERVSVGSRGAAVGALVAGTSSHHGSARFTEQSMHSGAVGVVAHEMHQGSPGVALQSTQNGSVGYREQSSHPGLEASVKQLMMHTGSHGIVRQSNSSGSITSVVGALVGTVGTYVAPGASGSAVGE
jgi:hypothetical protein